MWNYQQVYSGYVTGIMGDEDNPQEERIDSVCEILSGATEEVRYYLLFWVRDDARVKRGQFNRAKVPHLSKWFKCMLQPVHAPDSKLLPRLVFGHLAPFFLGGGRSSHICIPAPICIISDVYTSRAMCYNRQQYYWCKSLHIACRRPSLHDLCWAFHHYQPDLLAQTKPSYPWSIILLFRYFRFKCFGGGKFVFADCNPQNARLRRLILSLENTCMPLVSIHGLGLIGFLLRPIV